jgi:3-dehydroquinate synthase
VDELETNERRMLNYGHTLGHAIEACAKYAIPHGIAVMMGILMINHLVVSTTFTTVSPDVLVIHSLLRSMIPPEYIKIAASCLTVEMLSSHLANDKKNLGDSWGFVLLTDLGVGHFQLFPAEEIKSRLEETICYLSMS